jgi:hypothetical protein
MCKEYIPNCGERVKKNFHFYCGAAGGECPNGRMVHVMVVADDDFR